jgi:hypothetical protein
MIKSILNRFEKKQVEREKAVSEKKSAKAKQAKSKWRLKSEAFRASIRAARGEAPADPAAEYQARAQLAEMEEAEGAKVRSKRFL